MAKDKYNYVVTFNIGTQVYHVPVTNDRAAFTLANHVKKTHGSHPVITITIKSK